MRNNAREAVFKVLYSELMGGDGKEELLMSLLAEAKCGEKDIEFAKRLYEVCCEHREELDAVIGELAKNYKLERVYSTDRCALILGLSEMTYCDDVPNIVAIDEALSLCRAYSTLNSVTFVNGIFAEYKKRLEKEN